MSFSKLPEKPEPDTNNLTEYLKALQDMRLALWIPIFQSLALAVTGAVLVFVLGLLLGQWGVWRYALAVFVIVLTWSVWGGIRQWSGDLGRIQTMIESAIKKKLDGEKPPEPAEKMVPIEVTNKDGYGETRQILRFYLPDLEGRLKIFAAVVINKDKFSGREFTEREPKLFSQGEFDRLRDLLIQRGLAAWINPAAPKLGLALTVVGRKVLRKYAGVVEPSETLPSPTEEVGA